MAKNGIAVNSVQRKLSPQQWADMYGVSCITVYRLIERGQLDAVKIGNQWRIDADAVPRQKEA